MLRPARCSLIGFAAVVFTTALLSSGPSDPHLPPTSTKSSVAPSSSGPPQADRSPFRPLPRRLHPPTPQDINPAARRPTPTRSHNPPAGATPAPHLITTGYLYEGWGDPPSVPEILSGTGLQTITLAFVLSGSACDPRWDGLRPLSGGADAAAIAAIRAGGRSAEVAFGGWSGRKLETQCRDAPSLAAAYQRVINVYGLQSIDVDLEGTDVLGSDIVQDRVLNALALIRRHNIGLHITVTVPTTQAGLTPSGRRLIERARYFGSNIDVYSVMTFNFWSLDMLDDSIRAATSLKDFLMTTFQWSEALAYRHIGLSGMNGVSDSGEVTTPNTWRSIGTWGAAVGLSRLALWSVNRDRPCAILVTDTLCSGIDQTTFEFSQITASAALIPR
jgi:hypothetical protein